MSDQGFSEAFYEASMAIGRLHGGPPPLPEGVTTWQDDNWHLAINISGQPAKYTIPGVVPDLPATEHDIQPYSIHAHHKQYFVIGCVDSGGGIIGGMSEGDFIDAMKLVGV